MFLIKLALRNLRRHRRRMLVTASVIALGVMIYVLMDSLLTGMTAMSFENIIDLQTGHVQVMDQDYWEEREEVPLDNLIDPDRELLKKLKTIPHIQAITPQLKFAASLTNGLDELPVIAVGIDPALNREVFTIHEYLEEGSMPRPGKKEAVLGREIGQLMDLKVGDYLTLLVKTKEGTFNTIDAQITGFLNTPNPEIDNGTVYVPLDIAQQALNVDNQVSQLLIKLEERNYSAAAASGLKQILSESRPELSAYTWRDAAGSVVAMARAQQAESQVTVGILLILAAVGIINTIILAALERLEELGMMKAMGMKEWEIMFTFIIESIGISIIGGVIGCILGAAANYFQVAIGYDLAWFGMENMDFGLPITRFYGVWHLPGFIFGFFYAVIVSTLVSIFPAWWAARKDPVEAIYRR